MAFVFLNYAEYGRLCFFVGDTNKCTYRHTIESIEFPRYARELGTTEILLNLIVGVNQMDLQNNGIAILFAFIAFCRSASFLFGIDANILIMKTEHVFNDNNGSVRNVSIASTS